MKVHYINILLFAHALNILVKNCQVNTHKKNTFSTHHTPKISTTRLLCECELYMPNYDNDPQMKRVMQQFEDRTSERLQDYDDRMKATRQKCKEKCDKEIQKIILKDKLEKQMAQQFATLQTDIQSDAIPTCVCEKSLADKVEKGCLRCAQNLGGIVAPSTGVLSGIGEGALYAWKPLALKAATKYAIKEGAAQGAIAGNALGKEIVIKSLEQSGVRDLLPAIWEKISSIDHFTNVTDFAGVIYSKKAEACSLSTVTTREAMCKAFDINFGIRIRTGSGVINGPPGNIQVPKMINGLVEKATQSADALAKDTAKKVTAEITTENTNLINTICVTWDTTIIASVVAIVVIVLIMVIIYKILRYRRKKKMKKKLQYIKFLEE
ncbi:rifin PIR protein, putative [Plasmodium reichenowi]|uniref:Rifin PIR protein, putative n=1 Tax=Plasmodium reichenowi TaxID=5854 RepID=A0A2P9D4T3_PLARE|nr:rifin PIR protein, putative [Plasmodium reichenowi]